MVHLVVYQTSDRRLRGKLRRLLRAYGWEILPGVFECPLVPTQGHELIRRLEDLVSPTDQVRVYQVCETCWGRSWPEMDRPWPENPKAYYF